MKCILANKPKNIYRDLSYSVPEIQYIKSQRLARIATASPDSHPDVVPVAFQFDGKYFYLGSHSQDIFHRTRKYKNVRDGNKWVALTIDDLESVDLLKPRGIKVYGTAQIIEHNGMFGPGRYLRITPDISWSWGIRGPKTTKTVHHNSS